MPVENKEQLWSSSDEARRGRNFVRATLAVILAVALVGVVGPEAYSRPAAIGVALLVFRYTGDGAAPVARLVGRD
ncbi:hypothetical protein ACFSTD_23885 [Novosphingobium colocasiae]